MAGQLVALRESVLVPSSEPTRCNRKGTLDEVTHSLHARDRDGARNRCRRGGSEPSRGGAGGDGSTTTTTGGSDDTTPVATNGAPEGPFCASIPPEGEGSFAGMADDPVATAASNNPYLTTLTSAVQAAGLADTLNGEGPFTVFAPNNEAFAAIPPADLDGILANTEWLTTILLYHVVIGESLSSADLARRWQRRDGAGRRDHVLERRRGSLAQWWRGNNDVRRIRR